MKFINKCKNYAPVLIRIGIALVFLWFGLNQIFDRSSFLGWLPEWVHGFTIKPLTLILFNGLFETAFGILLIFGLFTRISALLLSLHLLGIVFTVGYNDIGVRDFGLLISTLSILLHGPDYWSLDRKVKNSKLRQNRLIKLLYMFDI